MGLFVKGFEQIIGLQLTISEFIGIYTFFHTFDEVVLIRHTLQRTHFLLFL